MTVDIEALARDYHLAKNYIDNWEEEIDKAMKADLRYQEAKEQIAKIEGELIQFLEDTKQKNAGTRYGTIHTVTRYSAPISAPDEFMGFVIENRMWDMLDKKANVTAVKAWVQEHKELPPGVTLSANRRLSITAPKEPL